MARSLIARSFFLLLATELVGCGGTGEEVEPVASSEEAIALGCDTRAADKKFIGKVDPAHISPRTYGPYQGVNSCYNYYIVDVTSLEAAYTTTAGDYPANISAGFGDSMPTSRAACEGTWTEATLFRRQGNQWIKEGDSQQATGLWYNFFALCFAAEARFFGMQAGQSYRVVVSARQGGILGASRRVFVKTNKAFVED